jgi:hypothetical protein
VSDNRREQLISFVEKEFIGPDPIDLPGMIQSNGEEILVSDPPRVRYSAGILFPLEVFDENTEPTEDEVAIKVEEEDIKDNAEIENHKKTSGESVEFLEDAEELINRSNAYKQSAMSITAAVKKGDNLTVNISMGTYNAITKKNPENGKEIKNYQRIPFSWNNDSNILELPDQDKKIQHLVVGNTSLHFHITHRYYEGNFSIFTFTLENTKKQTGASIKDADCYFQVKFTIASEKGFSPLPENQRINIEDEDYWSNQLLYRYIKNYAVGHGCAADWSEKDGKVFSIATAIFPQYEIKPILPSSIPGVSLEMIKMSDIGIFEDTINELETMCERYCEWIDKIREEASNIEDRYKPTAEKHISNCQECLKRMREGLELLEDDDNVRKAFQYMNRAMLMQQLHFNLPLQKWIDDGHDGIRLYNPVKKLPDVLDAETWYDSGNKIYGKWRPFQLAFILMNLKSMADKTCGERNIVDLIWFPTGGGKTEAYLGLSAYAIFIRRLKNKDDVGTAILMRYTLRLLTAQQYERASAMICACDIIRKENPEALGNGRISIGLWVGGDTTPNYMNKSSGTIDSAVKAYDKLKNGKSDRNPFVMLKCPWCGAQMGVVIRKNGNREIYETPGYKKIIGKHGRKKIIFQCNNSEYGCDFSAEGYELPLYIVDDDIYEKKPTLLLGTVDKFAMLPFRPEARGLFGYQNGVKISSPDLIIQDELHLISGPLGSMVGHYETLIGELCTQIIKGNEIHPKIIASTATISRAKEQCHALYGCGKENIFQFPPSGLNAGNSFFAEEDTSRIGRKYVGILASGSSSDTTTSIRLFSSLLYGTKGLDVASEEMRDPYWTNIGYFNSIRELGQAATWIRADIAQHLDVMYKRRYEDKKANYKQNRRYIWRDEELTSRIRSDKVTASLENLNIRYPVEESDEGDKRKEYPIDICLATNMISVGLDVPRLGLMTVAGQPKTTSEYIQATSRIGRDTDKAPGVVFVLYRPGRPRDKSHYEQFRSYHSRLYCNVEPTSVTPFSSPLRERALHAIMIGIMRLESDDNFNNNPPRLPDKSTIDRVQEIIKNRVNVIDQDEIKATLIHMDNIIQNWEDWQPDKFHDFTSSDALPLMFPAGSRRNEAWGEKRGLETPTSMRSVDACCEAYILENRYIPEEL